MGTAFRREVKYRPLPSQAEFHRRAERIRGFSGPVGSGKSAALVNEALKLAYVNRACLGLIGAATYRMLADVTRLAFLRVLEENSVPHEFRRSDNAVVLPEPGSMVLFRSLDQPERLIGSNLAWFACDELTYAKEEAWKRLEARLRDQRARQLAGIAVWTPKGFDWVYHRFIGPKRIAGYHAVIAQPGENYYLPDDYYDWLKQSYDERFYRQEAMGEYLPQFSGQAYYNFCRRDNVRELQFDPRWPLCLTCDFNIDPMCWALAQVIDVTTPTEALQGRRRTMVHVLDELVLPDCRTAEACLELGRRLEPLYRQGLRSIAVYGDASGTAGHTSALRTDWQTIRDYLRRETRLEVTWKVPEANPPVRERVGMVCAMLRNEAGDRRLLVDPRCQELILDLEQVAWKRDAGGGVRDSLDGRDPRRTHISDALGYLVWRACKAMTAGPRRTPLL